MDVSRTRQPGPLATFDLDAALAIVSRLCTDFGGSVVDVDFDGTEMHYVVDVPKWGRSAAKRSDLVVRNRVLGRVVSDHCSTVRRWLSETRPRMEARDAATDALRERISSELASGPLQ
jgi:hypothetical protein